MALADPQSVTISGTAYSCPKTVPWPATFADSTGAATLVVSQETTSRGRKRRAIDLKFSKIVADPITGLNRKSSATCRLLVDAPGDNTFTTVQQRDLITAMVKWLNADGASPTYVNADKVCGGES